MYLFFLIVAGCIGVLIGFWMKKFSSDQSVHQEDMEKIARKNFYSWVESLKTKDPKKVASHYHHEELTFHPTKSSSFTKSNEGLVDYFVKFCKKSPIGILVEDHVKVLTPWLYLHSGLYDFKIIDEKGVERVIEARFTFIWFFENGEWKIIHHHSSEKPGH